jgi:hypothetical protein
MIWKLVVCLLRWLLSILMIQQRLDFVARVLIDDARYLDLKA